MKRVGDKLDDDHIFTKQRPLFSPSQKDGDNVDVHAIDAFEMVAKAERIVAEMRGYIITTAPANFRLELEQVYEDVKATIREMKADLACLNVYRRVESRGGVCSIIVANCLAAFATVRTAHLEFVHLSLHTHPSAGTRRLL
jgi:hypothetical protein